MKTQNLKNHWRTDRAWLIAFLVLLFMTFVISKSMIAPIQMGLSWVWIDEIIWWIVLPLATLLIFWILIFKLRGYATTLQDRIIRQEVDFRHYLLTGKTLDPKLSIKQIIALRFAGDQEFVALCEKAVSENLSNKEIKKLITDRKADYLRV